MPTLIKTMQQLSARVHQCAVMILRQVYEGFDNQGEFPIPPWYLVEIANLKSETHKWPPACAKARSSRIPI